MSKPTHIRIPDPLLARLDFRASQTGFTRTHLILDAIAQYLDKEKVRLPKPAPTPPPKPVPLWESERAKRPDLWDKPYECEEYYMSPEERAASDAKFWATYDPRRKTGEINTPKFTTAEIMSHLEPVSEQPAPQPALMTPQEYLEMCANMTDEEEDAYHASIAKKPSNPAIPAPDPDSMVGRMMAMNPHLTLEDAIEKYGKGYDDDD